MKLLHRIATSGIAVLSGALVACTSSANPSMDEPAPDIHSDARILTFDNESIGELPVSFTPALTGGGGAVHWEIESQQVNGAENKLVTQLSKDKTNARYPLLVHQDFIATDVDVALDFKTLSGKVDASGGIVFRYLDSKNYYVVRANSLEGNVVAYKTINGKRTNIGVRGKSRAYGVNVPVMHQRWQTLRVIAKGAIFGIYLDDKKIFEVENDALTQPGNVGMWTKADAVTQFDNLTFRSLD